MHPFVCGGGSRSIYPTRQEFDPAIRRLDAYPWSPPTEKKRVNHTAPKSPATVSGSMGKQCAGPLPVIHVFKL